MISSKDQGDIKHSSSTLVVLLPEPQDGIFLFSIVDFKRKKKSRLERFYLKLLFTFHIPRVTLILVQCHVNINMTFMLSAGLWELQEIIYYTVYRYVLSHFVGIMSSVQPAVCTNSDQLMTNSSFPKGEACFCSSHFNTAISTSDHCCKFFYHFDF